MVGYAVDVENDPLYSPTARRRPSVVALEEVPDDESVKKYFVFKLSSDKLSWQPRDFYLTDQWVLFCRVNERAPKDDIPLAEIAHIESLKPQPALNSGNEFLERLDTLDPWSKVLFRIDIIGILLTPLNYDRVVTFRTILTLSFFA